MKLNQLRYIAEVAKRGLNISAAADAMYTSQPGVSKQIRLLEDELGVQIFARSGKHLTHITPAGRAILESAERILGEVQNIRSIAADFVDEQRGSLSIATTHTQARHALPRVVGQFRERYPNVSLHIHQGTPMQIAEMAARGQVDFAIATEALELFEDLVMLPCYRWNRSVIVPEDHPLTQVKPLTLEAIAEWPLVTYVFGFTGRSKLDEAFDNEGLEPNVVFTATDSEVIKTYVRLGLGVGIIASMSFEPERDEGLVAVNASHLFQDSITNIGFRRGAYLRGYMYEFMELFAPHLTSEVVERAIQTRSAEEREAFLTELQPLIRQA
ncbi:LysR family transcriptional regulator [Alkalispirillum mobile]|uniref:LysR family transcriptional regulator n=1 Tax=Alkalispirillum mobile TaxID=85925 RepID=A0A498C6A7_9GAMM|nr:HTH-type transcriptional regulator CysB [Alkalispirillum mobile]RLK50577.1 LysR family transcriptional regulator [Alkalispirillum mobile]